MTAIGFVQSIASRKLAACKCGSYPQCVDCVLFRLVIRLLDAMSTSEPTTATGRIQRHAVEGAANELRAEREPADEGRDTKS